MNEFTCMVCKEKHQLITLIEFPPPSIIFDITTGKADHDLNLPAKNIYLIDKELCILECELSLDIIDYEDQIDFLVWVEIPKDEFYSNREKFYTLKEIVHLTGKLCHEIPLYDNTYMLEASVAFDLSDEDKPPKISDITKEIELKQDFYHGISFEKVRWILSILYH